MDRRSWPWKKKSSDKAIEKILSSSDYAGASFVSAGSQGDQEISKKVNYVQISVESYTQFTGLEEQVKVLEDQVKLSEDKVMKLNEKLTSAESEMTTKDNLVKQHAKVAEEAVSGWEKAEAEASALKHQLESVTLLKLTAEDQASHLDGALKECMRQIRNLKEEHELKLHEVVLTKTKQWDKVKLDFEAKMDDLEQELLRSSAENAALSRSLQEHSNMLMKIREEKSRAEADIELLKTNIQSCEKEISSLKYELHIISKELEIRNEEKNMSIRSAEVANKQHLEGVKKIAKLEAECQRLRGLVRKKLPGPAALAQMKQEVENLGRDYGEIRPRRSPVRSPRPSSHLSPLPEFSLDDIQQCHKEAELLTARLVAMEEETKMLKEALAKRNSEVQASRNMCAKTASRLRSLEAQMQALNQQKGSPKITTDIPVEGTSSQNASNPPSLTSMSEDGIDEDGSCAESWATVLISDQFKKESDVEKIIKADNHLELMDDFLEMERLACLSPEPNTPISTSDGLTDKVTKNVEHRALADVAKCADLCFEQQAGLDSPVNQVSSNVEHSAMELECNIDQVTLSKLRSRISLVFESQAKDANVEKILKDIKQVVLGLQDSMPQNSVSSTVKKTHSADSTSDQLASPQEDIGEPMVSGFPLAKVNDNCEDNGHIIDQELAAAISQIHDFVVSLGKEAMSVQDRSPDGHGLYIKIEEFSASFRKILCTKMSLVDFVLDLSRVMAKAGEVSFSVQGYKGNEGETSMSDCIDKVALPENKVFLNDPVRERFPNGCAHISHSISDPEVLQEGSPIPGFELNSKPCKCSLEELEQLKSDKHNIEMDLTRCTEEVENTRSQLQETEQLLAELKAQLASSQKSNSLAETQLKCMAESYKLLETHAQELEAELNLLHAKAEALDNELQEEKRNHQNALKKCNDLQVQIKRSESCSKCLSSSAADIYTKTKQREIAAATEKLSECQETIFLLSRQLKALRPQTELTGFPHNEMRQMGESFMIDEPSPRDMNPESIHGSQNSDQAEMESAASSNVRRVSCESPSDAFNSPISASDTEANMLSRSPVSSSRPRHRTTRSGSSTSSSAQTPEKNSRGFSRFFSSKTKNGY
ncbi:filament-like plant protein 4 isoform X2 [Macadamia integrifolia]|uniref:filament-like plant protein 4 isoform X2 n=1 Tax=Macadamia integrifolia TaxID=60698 RepID=UPI001C4ECD79|nr:filament-like plant protein 4 isoform X2 [Macadamia integrifolia]